MKNGIDNSKVVQPVEVNMTLPSDEELYNKSFLKFQEKCGSLEFDCEALIQKDINETKASLMDTNHSMEKENSKNITFLEYVFDTNYMIIFIYMLLILAVNFPISTILYIKFGKIDKLDNCLVPYSCGIIYNQLMEANLWEIYCTLTPRQRHESEKRYKNLLRASLS